MTLYKSKLGSKFEVRKTYKSFSRISSSKADRPASN